MNDTLRRPLIDTQFAMLRSYRFRALRRRSHRIRVMILTILAWLSASDLAAIGPGAGTVTFVDGTQTHAEILFEHPNAPRLVVRSLSGTTVQTLDVSVLRKVTIDDRTTTYNERRPLTEAEQRRRERNRIWGDLASEKQIGRYAEETWEPKPLIVWRHPGTSGSLMKAENWLDETGKPLKEMPFVALPKERQTSGDMGIHGAFDGDVLIPAGDESYMVIQPGQRDVPGNDLPAYRLRHLTVESGAIYSMRLIVRGNLWMKDGGNLTEEVTGVFGSGEANKDTFARFCNYHDLPAPNWAFARLVSHLFFIDTGETGSLEIIGRSRGAADRITLKRGTLIISEDGYFGNGSRAAYYAAQGTTTVLLDGARLGSQKPLTAETATYAIAGTLMFGTPDHPLTEDLPFGGCYYPQETISPDVEPSPRSEGASFVLGSTGRMVIHSADPREARVRFQGRATDRPIGHIHIPEKYDDLIEETGEIEDPGMRNRRIYRADPKLWQQPEVPNGVAAVFKGQTDFNGVVFDDFYQGGIIVSKKAKQRWKNVFFGKGNHGDPESLFHYIEPGDEEDF